MKFGPLASVAMLVLAGLAALEPLPMSWVYIGAVALFEFWLLLTMRGLTRRGPVPVNEPPYRFTAEEGALIERYRLYFTLPALAGGAASVLSAIGLASAVLALWLTFRQQPLQGAILGVNLFAVGWFTKRVAPVYALRIAASKGKRDALRALELIDPLWTKIRQSNRQGS